MLESLGLDKDLMALLVGEANDFVLDRRAVARAGGLDLAGVHRRAVKIRADHLVRLRAGVGQVAEHLRQLETIGENREVMTHLTSDGIFKIVIGYGNSFRL